MICFPSGLSGNCSVWYHLYKYYSCEFLVIALGGFISKMKYVAVGWCDIRLNGLYVNIINCVLILLNSSNLLLVRAIDLAIAGWLAGLVLISSGIMTGEPGMVSPCSALCQRGNEDGCTATVVETVALVTVVLLWGIVECWY